MGAHRKKRRRLVPLAAVAGALSLVAMGIAGEAAMSGSHAPVVAETLNSTWVTSDQHVAYERPETVYACLAAGKLARIALVVPVCPANAIVVHWGVQSSPSSLPSPTSSSSPLPSPSSSPSSSPSPSPSPSTSAPASPSAPPSSSPIPLPRPSGPSSPPRTPPSPGPAPSSSSTPPIAVPSGLVNCTTNQNGGANNNVMQLDNDEYHLQANEWNSGATFKICTNGNPDFTISSSGIDVTHDGAPGGYPSIYKGCHWGYCTADSGMPVAVSTMASTPNKVTTTYRTSTVNSGAWDDSYDIWYNPNKTTSSNNSGLEMMIWLNHFGGTQPAGSAGPTVTLDGISFTVWYGGSGNGGTVSFVANNPVNSVDNLDLGPLAAYAVSKGYMQNSWFLIDVEAGFEPWTSGQGLTADSFNVTVH